MNEKQEDESRPIFTKQDLISLIWPLLLEQFLSVSMGMADTLMVSGVGEAAVSSVSLVDSLNILIIQILSALATGGAVVSSQYLGHKDMKQAKKSSSQCAWNQHDNGNDYRNDMQPSDSASCIRPH